VCGSSAPTHLAHGYRVRTGRRWTQAASMLVSMNHQRVLSDAAGHAAPRSEESADDPAVTGAAGMTYEMSSPSSTRARACRRLISCPFSHVETVPRPTPSIAANSACVSWRRIRRCRIASARLMRFHVRRMCDEPYMNRRTHVKHESSDDVPVRNRSVGRAQAHVSSQERVVPGRGRERDPRRRPNREPRHDRCRVADQQDRSSVVSAPSSTHASRRPPCPDRRCHSTRTGSTHPDR
jgi:hypothetical protein